LRGRAGWVLSLLVLRFHGWSDERPDRSMREHSDMLNGPWGAASGRFSPPERLFQQSQSAR